MDLQPGSCIEIDFLRHYIIECRAEKNEVEPPNTGGNVTSEIKVEIPTKPEILKLNDTFDIRVLLECIGVSKNKEPAFYASCKMEGIFVVTDCPHEGITTANNRKLLSLAASCLYPLLAQYVGEMISRMGFKNVPIPPFSPKQMIPLKKTAKSRVKKVKEISS